MDMEQELARPAAAELSAGDRSKKNLMLLVLVIGLLTLAGMVGYYWYMSAHYVRTEDARVDATMVSISPQITGRIDQIFIAEGDKVSQNTIIARQVDFTLASSANLEMAVIKSPVSGTVIRKIANVGETGTPGQPIAMVADIDSVFITANVEETELHKVAPGQLVEFTVDAFPGYAFTGQVSSIVNATVSTFSLLSSSNTGGNFTKVVQRIPVKISIHNLQGCKLMPGMNAIVKIHVS